jgi:hypothetical protein
MFADTTLPLPVFAGAVAAKKRNLPRLRRATERQYDIRMIC